MAWFVEPIQTTDGAAYPWGIEMGKGEDWMPVSARREDFAFPFGIHAIHVLQPALLPAQMAAPRPAGRVRYVAAATWSDPQAVEVIAEANLLTEVAVWQALLDDATPLVIPAHTHRQVVLDLADYVCAYPQLQLSGGSGSRLIDRLGRGAPSGRFREDQRAA